MKMLKATVGISILFFTINHSIFGQADLTITDIMKGDDFVGYLPKSIYWSENSKSIYFTWNPDQDLMESTYKADLKGLIPYKVALEELKNIPARNGHYTKEKSKKVYEKNGDIFLYHIRSGKTDHLVNTLERESSPVFTNSDTHIVFRKENNLYSLALESGKLRQITNFISKDSNKRNPPTSHHKKWIENDEMELFDVLQTRKAKNDLEKALEDSLKPERPSEIMLNGQFLRTLKISPDEKFVVFNLIKQGPRGNNTEVPNYVTESGYAEMIRARSKVGSPEGSSKLGVYDIEKDTSYYFKVSDIPGVFDKPEFLKDYIHPDSTFDDLYKKPRRVYYQSPVFNESGDKVVIIIRSADNKDRWIMKLNLRNGSFDLLDRQRDESWIGGPGIGEWNFERQTIGWLSDDNTIWFQSEESGYSHLYTLNTNTKVKTAITSGNWEVYKVILSGAKKHFYITANKEGPAERHVYKVPVGGGDLIRYTRDPGNYQVFPSPDERMLAFRYSYSNKPWELYIMPNKPMARMHQVTYSTTPEFNNYPWREPELIQFPAEDGQEVHARLYRPDNAEPGGPAVIFVHGAGYLQNAHAWWSSYFREYMFHNFLVDQGYTVLDIDYRGSEGYGQDWRTGVYRHMGGKDLTDHADGAAYLVKEHHIDPGKIGIYGGSYGGFITIYAMFKYPETFKCGAALRSVTDWAHYNHPYTSNRLNTPVEDSIAYKNSSPIYYADGLKGELIMLHGMIDTNVHFQDVVRLSQKLIELGKTNWDVAIFPLEDHGFKEPSSWADEYRRIFELFERNLK
jgi:dipeptidyl aminopeptidase/acylaminoacyl peptidase